ncbi:MAG: 2-dehydropantoate 2-reductase [Verrucomicrobiae bacterium]|nr:2-dehydropantoate 2-reductase [Verrucomicrobiae bacterium]
MKTAIVGCGAVGSYYGAQLCRDGHEVHFLLRSDYDAVRRQGVRVHSPAGDFTARPRCARFPSDIGVCEVVFIALKTTANDQFSALLPPLIGPQTVVITLQNGLGNEDQLARLIPATQILGGLCFVCLNRVAPGEIHHLDHGLIVLGEYQRPPEPRTEQVAASLRRAGVPCQITDNLARAHWEKLVWNIPFNGLGVASAAGYEAVTTGRPETSVTGECLTTDRLLADSKWESLVRELMGEVITVARALGHDIAPALGEKMIERTRSMGPYKASTLLDFEMGRPLELESLFLEPLRQAQRAGVCTPRLESMNRVLRRLDSVRAR